MYLIRKTKNKINKMNNQTKCHNNNFNNSKIFN